MINKKKGGFAKRYQASYESKDSGAPAFAGVMNWKKVDSDVNFFSPIEGKNRINIIPYTIKTKNHPLVKRGEFEVGDQDYVMDVFTHRGVGPSEATVICLKSTFGKPCPICEQSALLRKQGKEKEAGELKPSRRVFYNVQDMKEPDKLKVFETSHFLFEKELIDEARDDEEGGFVDFADPIEGKEIKFRASEVQKGKIKYKEFKSFAFEDRDDPIPDELLESAISFDEIMNVPTYEEVEKILFGQDDDDDEESDESAKKSKHDDSDEEDDDRPVKKFSKKYEDEDDELEEKPAKKPVKNRDDENEDDEEESSKKPVKKVEDEDNEPEPSNKSCGKCPFGHCFGQDDDKYDECDNCDVWDKCVKENKNNK
jgi:hypothetical protein